MTILSLPRTIYLGEGSLDEFGEYLKENEYKRALIITDKIIEELGLLDNVKKILNESKIEFLTFNDVEPEPSFETVEKGGETARRYKPDLIIAVGGGSVIDAAKAIWIKYEKPEFNLEELSPFVWLGIGEKAKLVAIPTTSGTGSEATIGVVLSKKDEGKKIALGNYEVVPYYSVIDPLFPQSMPQKLTAITGIDALSHGVECYVSNNSNSFTDALAEKSVEIIFTWLPRAYRNGSDKKAREKMHIAAMLAGMAFSNSGLGISHALGHSFGPIFKIPHGFAVGLFLPYVIKFNAEKDEATKAKYASLGKIIGVSGNSINELFEGFVSELKELYKKVNAPLKVKDLGIKENEYFGKLNLLVENAYEDPDIAFNPVMVTPDDIEKIFESAFDGGEV